MNIAISNTPIVFDLNQTIPKGKIQIAINCTSLPRENGCNRYGLF